MTRARSELISLSDTPYYHCISRCVRRAFLCGVDHLTGKNYEHRKPWVVARLTDLGQAYAIDIASYAVMSNHVHLVLRVDQKQTQAWDDETVMDRWESLHTLPVLLQRHRRGEATSQGEQKAIRDKLNEFRSRLCNISWFMRDLNEHLARKANAEDNCKGHFWESRFKSQALLDEAAVLSCMSYVDLNPIRAAMASTLEDSDYTSVQQRIVALGIVGQVPDQTDAADTKAAVKRPRLMPLVRANRDRQVNSIGYTTDEYLELVDWAGRHIREGKRGAIDGNSPPVLQRLGLDDTGYLAFVSGTPDQDKKAGLRDAKPRAIGSLDNMMEALGQTGLVFLKGMGLARSLYRASG